MMKSFETKISKVFSVLFVNILKPITVCIFLLIIESVNSQTPVAEVIKYETSIIYKSNVLYKNISCSIKINNSEGDKYTKVSIPFSKLSKVSKLSACILDINGNEIKNINSSDITEHSNFQNFSFFEDNMVKEFTLKHNTYPYIMTYKYLVQEKQFLYIDSWVPIINDEIPTTEAILTVELPLEYPVSYQSKGIVNLKTDTVKEMKRYCWKSKFEPIDLVEKFMPNVYDYYNGVDIVPLNYVYEETGSFKNWTSYGNWQYNLIEKKSDLSAVEKEKINTLILNISDKNEQIKILYHYLQDETRYINISIKTGGMIPFPASFVAEKKYGDCKALTNYMKSLLSEIGITSYYTKVYADDAIKTIDKDFPSQQFNHVILCIPLSKDTIWLDCTSKGPFNYLGTFTQNRDAFIVNKNNSHFVKTPALKLNNVLDVRKVEFSLISQSEVLAKFENTYRSNDFSNLMYFNKYLNKNELNMAINDDYIEKGFDLIEYKISEPHRDSTSICLSYKATSSKIFNQYGNDKIAHLLPFDIPNFSKPKNRKFPIQLDFPIYKSDTLDYIISQHSIITNKFDNQYIKSDFGEYSIQYILQNSRIRVIKSFKLYAGIYKLKQYPAFYEFISKVKNIELNTLIIIN